jgi:hypothetical protein
MRKRSGIPLITKVFSTLGDILEPAMQKNNMEETPEGGLMAINELWQYSIVRGAKEIKLNDAQDGLSAMPANFISYRDDIPIMLIEEALPIDSLVSA